MALITIILIIVAVIIGFLIGKYITDHMKWSDKKKLIEERWKSKLGHLEKDHELAIKDLAHDWEIKYSNELSEIKDLIKGAEKHMRHDAVKRSRRTLLGKLWEQVSPYIPKFPFNPSDMKFLGAPIDFIVFDGMGEKEIKEVIFLEVKSGDSKLSTQERKLKKAIEEGRVSWKLFNVDKPEKTKLDEEQGEEEIEGETTPHELYEHIDEKIKSVTEDVEEDEDEE